ncbi:MAG TPA: 2-aminoethylphosphonate--pyruvate transaminase [Gemmataceae bacterium]|nr:2-aminoethylphosphonate--pyruvate transaminase [Gemmataceae bacterium]
MTATRKTCLLNPGPVTLTRRVRQALLRPDLCHREPEFAVLQTDVRARLEVVYEGAGHTAVLLTGSGTAAVEAMLGSLLPDTGLALVVANGVYGERMAAILQAQGKTFDTVRSEWIRPMDLAEVGRRLRADARITHVAAVHHETTTGRLNDLAALGAICRERGVGLLIDAVSSFGGERIDLEGWNVEGCAATANKCLHGVPGVAFVLARRSALESRPSGARGLYLDLHRNYQEQRKGGPLFTPAVQAMYALHEALAEFEEQGGWRRRHEHYAALSGRLRAGLAGLGFAPLLDDVEARSSFLSAFLLPAGLKFDELWSRLKKSGFVIYPGQQALQGAIFRVSVMGDLSGQDIGRFLDAVAAVVGRRAAPRS